MVSVPNLLLTVPNLLLLQKYRKNVRVGGLGSAVTCVRFSLAHAATRGGLVGLVRGKPEAACWGRCGRGVVRGLVTHRFSQRSSSQNGARFR
jgi:hypothetical protein